MAEASARERDNLSGEGNSSKERAGGSGEEVRLSELLGALSFALDLTEGQPYGHAGQSCLIGMRLAGALTLDSETRSDLYFALILKDTGCSSNAHETAELFGVDDHMVKREMKTVDWAGAFTAMRFGLSTAGRGLGPLGRMRQVGRMLRDGSGATRRLIRLRCERGAGIVRGLGFPEQAAAAVRALDEHWDGGGAPDGIAGEEIPLLGRILGLSQTVEIFAARWGWNAALQMARERSGSWFDPALVEVLEAVCDDDEWWARLYGEDVLPRVGGAEPPERVVRVDQVGVDRVAEAFADVVDAKTPFTYRHSSRVASIARDAGEVLALPSEAARDLYRAGLLHDIGKLGVSNRILDKSGPLTPGERLAVERHPVLTWTILGQVEVFAPIARVASVHHERLDGGGYPWGYGADELHQLDRVLAVADVYEALTADRPYREGMPREKALGILHELERAALDPESVRAVAAATEGEVRAG